MRYGAIVALVACTVMVQYPTSDHPCERAERECPSRGTCCPEEASCGGRCPDGQCCYEGGLMGNVGGPGAVTVRRAGE